MRRRTSSPSIRSHAINWRKTSVVHSVSTGSRIIGSAAVLNRSVKRAGDTDKGSLLHKNPRNGLAIFKLTSASKPGSQAWGLCSPAWISRNRLCIYM